VPDNFASQIKEGIRVKVPFGRLNLTGFVTKIETNYRKPRNIKLKEISSVIDTSPLFGNELIPLAKFITDKWGTPLGMVLTALVPPYLRKYKEEKEIKPPAVNEINLSSDENEIAKEILNAAENEKPQNFLFFYDNFSAKDKIVSHIVNRAVSAKSQILLLMPDIELANILAEKIQSNSDDENIVLWHAKISQSQKQKIWHRIHSGESLVIIGTRSAALLPFKNLFCAVVDYEEDSMYKQEENKPYFDAKEVLKKRGQLNGFPVILASPAPSLESIYDAIGEKIKLLRLKNPAAQKPQVLITSRKGEKSEIISDKLIEILNRTEKALIILNRKGVSNIYSCFNCGWMDKCPKCKIYMITEGKKLICPKCAVEKELPQECPECRNKIFKNFSYGIQKAKSELEKLFPDKKILEFDSQKTQTSADIILGTRFLARGHNFKNIDCVAFLNIDTETAVADYKSSEKIAQSVFGSLGYLNAENSYLAIQTSQPDNYKNIQNLDYMSFALKELEMRKDLKYPPHCKLIRIIISAADIKMVDKTAKKIISVLEKNRQTNEYLEILGPAPFGFKGKSKLIKRHIILKYGDDKFLEKFWQLSAKFSVRKGAKIKAVVDPADFY
jgi:primosomal protein N' (replication factor Y)